MPPRFGDAALREEARAKTAMDIKKNLERKIFMDESLYLKFEQP
jgi:hypothetical protein